MMAVTKSCYGTLGSYKFMKYASKRAPCFSQANMKQRASIIYAQISKDCDLLPYYHPCQPGTSGSRSFAAYCSRSRSAPQLILDYWRARNQSKHLGCDGEAAWLRGSEAWLRGCEAARLRGCEAARLQGCKAARLQGCKAATAVLQLPCCCTAAATTNG
jgi:hypothetical protein